MEDGGWRMEDGVVEALMGGVEFADDEVEAAEAGEDGAEEDEDEGELEGVVFAGVEPGFEDGEEGAEGEDGHAVLFGHGADEALFAGEGALQYSQVGRAEGEDGATPAEGEDVEKLDDAGLDRGAVTGADEDQDIGEAVGHFIEDGAGDGGFATFDGDHAVEQVAEQPALNAGGGGEPREGTAAAREVRGDEVEGHRQGGEDDAEDGDGIGSDAGRTGATGQGLRPGGVAGFEFATRAMSSGRGFHGRRVGGGVGEANED